MLYSALVIGFLGSLHCLGMCGPIALVLPVHQQKPLKKLWQIILYQFGRILTYGFIGLIFGLVGKGLYLAGFQQRLTILIGAIMIALVLIPKSILQKVQVSKSIYHLLNKVKSGMGTLLKKRSNRALFTLGVLNGFLPCGLVYMALVGAVAMGSSTQGAMYMLLFGLGTIPLMTAIVYFGNLISVNARNKLQKAIPVFVVLIGLLFITRGLGLGIPYVSPSDAKLTVGNEPVECVTE